ncbi:MAG: group 1 truncated hemoglobin [Gemmatimonadetes bacterium]|nr:group 1 truncated hemoglobin [Gemmatimonadota bacterium]
MHTSVARLGGRRLTAIALLLVTAQACATFGHRSPPASASLYVRLGGYDAVAAVTDDILARELKDPVVMPFFKGLETADLQRIRQHLVDQLCAAAGGPCFYPGKDMKTTHAEMEITPAVWNTFVGHILESLDAFKIHGRERNELVAIVNSLRKDIVREP